MKPEFYLPDELNKTPEAMILVILSKYHSFRGWIELFIRHRHNEELRVASGLIRLARYRDDL